MNPIIAAQQAAKAKGPANYEKWCRKMHTILHEASHVAVLVGHTTDDDYVTYFGRKKSGGGWMQTGPLENPLLEVDISLAGLAYEEMILEAMGLTDAEKRAEHINNFAGSDMEQAHIYLKEWPEWMNKKYTVYNRQPHHKTIPEPQHSTVARLRNFLEKHWPAVEYAAEYMMRHWELNHRPTPAWSNKIRKVIKDAGYRAKNTGWTNPRPPMDFLNHIATIGGKL